MAGGLGMMQGQAMEGQAPVPTRTRTEVESETEGYTDPAGDADLLALDDDEGADDIVLDDDQSDVFASGTEEDGWDAPAPELDDMQITVHIKTLTPGVPVSVDGRAIGVTPAVVDLADGDHVVALGPGGAGGRFTLAPIGNPDSWCFEQQGSSYKQTLCP